MGGKRKRHSNEFKAGVALAAVREIRSLGELASLYKVHPTQIAQWKKRLQELAPQVFVRRRSGCMGDAEGLTGPPYQEAGRLKRVRIGYFRVTPASSPGSK